MTDVSVQQSSFVKQYPGQHKRTGGLECSRCKNPRGPSGRYCNDCHAAYMREWRKTHPLTPEQRRKDNCRSYANAYQRRGKLVPQPCKLCKAEKAEKHHPDYSKPLRVIWLCRKCHLDLHCIEKRGLPMLRAQKLGTGDEYGSSAFVAALRRNTAIKETPQPPRQGEEPPKKAAGK